MNRIFIAFWGMVFLAACSVEEKEIAVFDVTKSYPTKEINVREVCGVEYVPIDDSVVVARQPRTVTNKYIIYTNVEGDVIFFDREGTFLWKFNHKGPGPEEYLGVGDFIYDEASRNVIISRGNRFVFYTEKGDFINAFTLGPTYSIANFQDFGDGRLLVDDMRSLSAAYLWIDKRSGRIVDSLGIAAEKWINPVIRYEVNGMRYGMVASYYNSLKLCDGFLLSHISTDTFFRMDGHKVLTPYFVRQPSVQKQDVPIFVNGFIETNLGDFFSTTERSYDPESKEGFRQKYFLRAKDGGYFYEVTVRNPDIDGAEVMLDPERRDPSDPTLGYVALESDELLEALEEGKIRYEPLARIAESRNEDSNPVLMLLRFD